MSDGRSDETLPSLPQRPSDAHKGSFGRVLLVGGSRGMAGSVAMSAMAAMRSGAGLGHAAVPSLILETVAAFEPCVMTHPLSCDLAGCLTTTACEEILELCDGKSVVGLGPGLSRSDQVQAVARELIASVDLPMVVDADALYAIGQDRGLLHSASAPRVLTPHPGEFARMTGRPVPTDEAGRREEAVAYAADFDNVVLVLKGAGTVVTDGQRTIVNRTGNPGMATAGSGDVLTGIITALMGQGMSAFDAAVLGVHAHGLAGDLAAEEVGQIGLVATDLIRFLPESWKAIADEVARNS